MAKTVLKSSSLKKLPLNVEKIDTDNKDYHKSSLDVIVYCIAKAFQQ